MALCCCAGDQIRVVNASFNVSCVRVLFVSVLVCQTMVLDMGLLNSGSRRLLHFFLPTCVCAPCRSVLAGVRDLLWLLRLEMTNNTFDKVAIFFFKGHNVSVIFFYQILYNNTQKQNYS